MFLLQPTLTSDRIRAYVTRGRAQQTAAIVIFVVLGCVAFRLSHHRFTPATPPAAPVASPSYLSSVCSDLPLPPEQALFPSPEQSNFMRSAYSYGFYLTLGRDLYGGVRSGRWQLWRRHWLVVRWLRSQHTLLPPLPYCPPRSANWV